MGGGWIYCVLDWFIYGCGWRVCGRHVFIRTFGKKEMVASQAACQVVLHFLKVVVFVYLGFQLSEWWGLLALLIVMTILGSFVGTRILEKIPQSFFLKFFKTIVIILSFKL